MTPPAPRFVLALVVPLWLLFVASRLIRGKPPYDDATPEDVTDV